MSILLPNDPVPQPPGANFLLRLPVYIVGFAFSCTIIFFLFLFLQDWGIVEKRQPIEELTIVKDENEPDDESENYDKEKTPKRADVSNQELIDFLTKNKLIHPETFSPEGCINCHFTPEEKPINNPQSELFGNLNSDDLNLTEASTAEFNKDVMQLKCIVGMYRGNKVCMSCHTPEEFDLKHEGHNFQKLEECSMCHTMHSERVERPLLKATKKELCEQCHDPDH
ncbi:MAG: cytochrome c3 family protein [Thermoguttaceae bacterium]